MLISHSAVFIEESTLFILNAFWWCFFFYLGSFKHRITLSARRDNFSFFPSCISFTFVLATALAKAVSTILNRPEGVGKLV